MVMNVFDHFVGLALKGLGFGEGKKIYSTIINYCHRLNFCWHFLNLGKITILVGHLKKNDIGYSIQ